MGRFPQAPFYLDQIEKEAKKKTSLRKKMLVITCLRATSHNNIAVTSNTSQTSSARQILRSGFNETFPVSLRLPQQSPSTRPYGWTFVSSASAYFISVTDLHIVYSTRMLTHQDGLFGIQQSWSRAGIATYWVSAAAGKGDWVREVRVCD